MELSDLLIGIVLAILFWKLLKITVKTFVWLVLAGLAVALFAPGQLPLVGNIGGLVLTFLGALLLLTVAGFFWSIDE